MPKFTIYNATSAATLLEGAHATAKDAIAALEEQAGKPAGGWGEDVLIVETWTDRNGDVNGRTMTVNEALES